MLEKTLNLLKKLYGNVDFINSVINVRENAKSCYRNNSKNIIIKDKKDKSGIDVIIKSGAKGDVVFVPAIINKSNVYDFVNNDFFIEKGANVIIKAGCALHTDTKEKSTHNGCHRFFIGENAQVKYYEKHLGQGSNAKKNISPITEIYLNKNSLFYMDSIQLSGIDYTKRETKAILEEGSSLEVNEKILTEKEQESISVFNVEAKGKDSSINIISKSVAKGNSKQTLESKIYGNEECKGHSECDAILEDNATAIAIPALIANHPNAELIHEAAIGRISREQIEKLQTLGLTEEEAEAYIIDGFLK